MYTEAYRFRVVRGAASYNKRANIVLYNLKPTSS